MTSDHHSVHSSILISETDSSSRSVMSLKSTRAVRPPANRAITNGSNIIGNNTGKNLNTNNADIEAMERIQQDILLIHQKLTQLNGTTYVPPPSVTAVLNSISNTTNNNGIGANRSVRPIGSVGESLSLVPSSNNPAPSSSPFVSGMRSLPAKDLREQRLELLQALLLQLTEFDKAILNKTTPEGSSNSNSARRKSAGVDLSCLPAHLRLVDRLVDFHAQAKRVTVIRQGDGNNNNTLPNPPIEVNTTAAIAAAVNAAETTLRSKMKLEADQRCAAITREASVSAATSAKEIESLKLQLAAAKTENLSLSTRPKEESTPGITSEAMEKAISDAVEVARKEIFDRINAEKDAALSAAQLESSLELDRVLQRLVEQEKLRAEAETALAAAESRLSSASTVSDAAVNSLGKEKEALLQENSALNDRLESEIALLQRVLSHLFQKASSPTVLREAHAFLDLPSDFQQAFLAVEQAVAKSIDLCHQETALVLSLKEALESDLRNSTLQRDLIQTDFDSLNEEHEALKTAYNALSYESATASDTATATNRIENLQRTVNEQSSALEQLKAESAELRLALHSLQKFPELVNELDLKLQQALADKVSAESAAKSATDEAAYYRKHCETLTERLRQMGTASNGNRDFLDTFEEVMRDEMATMKAAFEAKLRSAKEESEATSQRHKLEIQRLSSSNSATLLHGLPR